MKIGIILATIILIRLLAICVTGWHQMNPVPWEYEEVADNILAGNGFKCAHLGTTYRAFSPPVYPLLCAGIYSITKHSHLAVLLFQSLCSILLSIFVYLIALRFGDRGVARLSMLLSGLHPFILFYDIRNLHPLSLDTMFISLVILLFLRLRERPGLGRGLLLGLSLGIATLERGTLALFLPVGLLWLFLFQGTSMGLKAKAASVVLCGFLLTTGVWIGRNISVFKKMIFTISTQREHFWRGNNLNASGGAYTSDGRLVFELAPQPFKDELYKLDELGQQTLFQKEAWAFIKADWERFTRLYLKKLFTFWYFAKQSGLTYPRMYSTAYKFYYAVILSLAIVGLGVLVRRRRLKGEISLIVSLFITISLIHSLYYVEGRHRASIEPLLLIFTARGISLLCDKIKAHLKWTF